MIEINQLDFRYGKAQPLFSNLSLSLASGGICGLLGKNGTGKTTLLKLLSGLVFPKGGDCRVMGEVPRDRLPSFLQDIYLIPEDYSIPRMNAEEYKKCYSPFYPKFDTDYFDRLIAEFECPSHKLLTELSHGQKKKFLLAFGLASNCKFLFLDEPTNGLDIPSKSQFRKLLASAISDDRLFIISTHQVHDLENLIDTIVILDEGKVVLNASLDHIAKHLSFELQKHEPDVASCFYSEKNLYGYAVVSRNKNGDETSIDLEILFNTVLANKEQIQSLFSGGES